MKSPSSLKRDHKRHRPFLRLGLSWFFVGILIIAGDGDGYSLPPECVYDDIGAKICLNDFPRRIVSLAPNLTETLFGLETQDLLVGRTARCNRPPAVAKVAQVGAYLNPDLERIISLQPDLVLATRPGLREEIVNRLSGVGIAVFVEDCKSLDDVCSLIQRLGTLLGCSDRAGDLIHDIQGRRTSLRQRVEGGQKPSVLFAVGVKPLVVAGGNSFLGSLLREAGGLNIAENSPVPYSRFSFEEVMRQDPEYILVLDKECKQEECLNYLKKYTTLRAIQNGKVRSVDADLVARPSPRAADALETIAGVIHPGLLAPIAGESRPDGAIR